VQERAWREEIPQASAVSHLSPSPPPRKLCVQVWLLGVQCLGAKEQSGGGECLVLVEAEDLAAVPQVSLQSRVWRGKQGVVRIRVLVECACVVAGGCDASETTVSSHSFFAVARSAAPPPSPLFVRVRVL
jgi:hypothetical protein